MIMSLTKPDKKYIDRKFDKKFDEFFDKFISILNKNFLTKQEAYEVFATKVELNEVKERLTRVEDIVIGIKKFIDTEYLVISHRLDEHTMLLTKHTDQITSINSHLLLPAK